MHSPSPESLRIDVSISGECSSVEIIRCVFPRKSSGESRGAHDDHRARAVRARRSLLFMRLNSVRPARQPAFLVLNRGRRALSRPVWVTVL